MLPMIKAPPWFLGQMGVPGSDTPLGFRRSPRGNVFFVDSGHPDVHISNDGTDPNAPLPTVTHALAHCVNGNDDYIIVAPSHWNQATETWPITINKSNIHLLSDHYWQGTLGSIMPPGDTAGILLAADNPEIAGFAVDGGATHGCIEFPSAVQSWGVNIHDNRFAWEQAAQDGIRMTGAVDKVECKIYNNAFNDKITRDGIRIEQNATRGEIWNNVFRRVGGVGINLVTLCTDIYAIHDNIFNTLADAATGGSIFCNLNSALCMFWGNMTMHDKAAMAQVPYRDLGANHWGLNYYGILAIMPATV